MQDRRSILSLLAGAPLFGLPARARAAEPASAYPSRPIRMIVPLSPGGAIEVMARVIGERLTQSWGAPVIVESRPGGNGMIGAVAVSQSPADGYTALFTNSGLIQNAHLRPSPSFRFENFAPVGMVAYAPSAFAIRSSIPANTLAEFVDYVRANPGKVSFGSFGAGSSGHILGEMLNKTARIDMVHVAYRGESAAVQDLLGGQVAAIFGAAGSLGRQSGDRIRVLAVGSPKRLSGFPDLPTFADAGYANMNLPGWAAVFMSAGTPAEIVKKASDELVRVGTIPEVRAWLVKEGFEPAGMNSAEFATFLKNDFERWGEMIKRTGVRVDN